MDVKSDDGSAVLDCLDALVQRGHLPPENGDTVLTLVVLATEKNDAKKVLVSIFLVLG